MPTRSGPEPARPKPDRRPKPAKRPKPGQGSQATGEDFEREGLGVAAKE